MRPGDEPLKAVAMLLSSLVLMAILSALVKLVSERQGLAAIMFFRFAASLLPLARVLQRSGGISVLRTGQPLQHALRSVFGICGIGCYFYALGRIPIADATALTYSAPLFPGCCWPSCSSARRSTRARGWRCSRGSPACS
ncbi:MAG: DMT family transporter [Gammaproteobacteria bacterium]|nr:DMT family transporter [Gammaproteobacteria bacterium]